MAADWKGVYPAVTTQFHEDESLDLDGTIRHCEALLDAGCHGLVMLGTLGEGNSLEQAEKIALLSGVKESIGDRAPVLAGVAEYTTSGACGLAEASKDLGLDGLMVLPAMVYKSDRRETLAHFRAVGEATDLPIMLYNNPVSYGVDITPQMFAELAHHDTFVAIKESSDDVRRVTDIINECGDRYTIFCGVDDLALEAILMGAEGWVAGLVNAFPAETVRIWELATEGRVEEARSIYRWFAPMLHLDTDVKLVQYIKLAVQEVGLGREALRAPRLPIEDEEREHVLQIIRSGIAARPSLD